MNLLTQTAGIGLVWGALQGGIFAIAGFLGTLFPDWHIGPVCVSTPRLTCVDSLNFYGIHFGPGAVFILWSILGMSIMVGYLSAVRTAIGSLLISQFFALLLASALLSIPQSPLASLSFPIVAISYSYFYFQVFFLGLLGVLAGVVLRNGVRRILREILQGIRERQ